MPRQSLHSRRVSTASRTSTKLSVSKVFFPCFVPFIQFRDFHSYGCFLTGLREGYGQLGVALRHEYAHSTGEEQASKPSLLFPGSSKFQKSSSPGEPVDMMMSTVSNFKSCYSTASAMEDSSFPSTSTFHPFSVSQSEMCVSSLRQKLGGKFSLHSSPIKIAEVVGETQIIVRINNNDVQASEPLDSKVNINFSPST